jgi:SAM-dependent methyltransferase
MNLNEIRKHWYANVYDQEVTETDDIEFLLDIIGKEPKNILEACCGTGRILMSLAKSGHNVTGFDIDEYMLERIPEKIKGLNNIKYYKANAVEEDWGKNHDIIILAGNVMMNIETDGSYEDAQRIFIHKAGRALKSDGYIYFDFALYNNPEEIFGPVNNERVVFEGYDDKGIYGKYIISSGGSYDKKTQICYGKRKIELILQNGEKDVYEYSSNKRIPNLGDIKKWLKENNFIIEQEYGNYDKAPISEKTHRAIIYARKIQTSANCT